MTAGEYLKSVLTKKNIQMSELAERMGLKSRNALYRLFGDRCSKEKAAELANEIAICAGLSAEELDGFYDRLSHNGESSFLTKTRAVLMNLYAQELPNGYTFEYNGRKKPLSEALSCRENARTDIFIAGISDISIIGDICAFMEENPEVRIHHYVKLRKNTLMTAYELVALTVFMNYRNYNPYISEYWNFTGICILEKDKCDCFVRKLEFLKNNIFFLESRLTSEMYEHMWLKQKKLNELSKPIKKPGKKVIDYIEILKDSMIFDDGQIFYSEGAPCFGTLTCEAAYDLFKKASFFGLPEEHPYVKGMIELYQKRQDTFLNTKGAKRYYLFDEEHMKNMLTTGISFDHPEQFPSLSKEQLRKYFEWLADMNKNHPEKIEIKFAKIPELRHPFVYGRNKMYYMYHSDSGYMDGFTVTIDEPGIFEIMNDFVDYVWDNFAVEGQLTDLLDKYL
ncbi:MAG: helix-turn-helix domain-containing protein [Candidatus Ornithomonoglobus sp.]